MAIYFLPKLKSCCCFKISCNLSIAGEIKVKHFTQRLLMLLQTAGTMCLEPDNYNVEKHIAWIVTGK